MGNYFLYSTILITEILYFIFTNTNATHYSIFHSNLPFLLPSQVCYNWSQFTFTHRIILFHKTPKLFRWEFGKFWKRVLYRWPIKISSICRVEQSYEQRKVTQTSSEVEREREREREGEREGRREKK